jgi:hypothetical protein
MRLSAALLSLAAAVIITGGCAMHVVVDPSIPRPDSVTRPALAAYMRSTPSPTIVLRVPAPQSQVAQAQSQQGNAAIDQVYNLIEKELVKANFAVRDRGLLDAIVRSGQNLDYPLILQRTDAQLILEIISIQSREFNSSEYARADRKGKGTLSNGSFPIQGWQFDCKVTLVRTGEIGGIYTIDIASGQNHFLVKGDKIQTATSTGYPSGAGTFGRSSDPGGQALGYSTPLADSVLRFVEVLIFNLKQG